ncbi:hypothetical protein SUDANB121_03252 [Nocardiopsis dassonvillei]
MLPGATTDRPFQRVTLLETSKSAYPPGAGAEVLPRFHPLRCRSRFSLPSTPLCLGREAPLRPSPPAAEVQAMLSGCGRGPRSDGKPPEARAEKHPPTPKTKKGGPPPGNPHNNPTNEGRPASPETGLNPQQKTVAATYSPTPPQGSTISARRLNDRVRNVTGCDPPTITTTETNTHTPKPQQRAPKPGNISTSYVKRMREHPIICSGQALGLLVPVSSTPHKASTPGLSTPSSIGSLTLSKEAGDLISKQASRLDAFSGYPSRT